MAINEYRVIRVRLIASGYPLFYGDIINHHDDKDIVGFAEKWYNAVYKEINNVLRHTCASIGFPLVQLQSQIVSVTTGSNKQVITLHVSFTQTNLSRILLDNATANLRKVKHELETYLDESEEDTEET